MRTTRTRVDLILHPVRMRIVQAVAAHGRTTRQIAGTMPDVPLPSLYRHLKLLTDAGMLVVTREQPVRGALERTYALDVAATRLTPEELGALGADDHRRMFMAFIASVMDAFERYLAGGPPDFLKDGVLYTQATFHLSDEEALAFGRDLTDVIRRAIAVEPGPGRRARTMSTIVIPERQSAAQEEG